MSAEAVDEQDYGCGDDEVPAVCRQPLGTTAGHQSFDLDAAFRRRRFQLYDDEEADWDRALCPAGMHLSFNHVNVYTKPLNV